MKVETFRELQSKHRTKTKRLCNEHITSKRPDSLDAVATSWNVYRRTKKI